MLDTLGTKLKTVEGDLVNSGRNLKLCQFQAQDTEKFIRYTQSLKESRSTNLCSINKIIFSYGGKKIRFMKIDLDDKTDVLTYHKKLLGEAEKEKEELKAKTKAGLGYGNQMNKGVLSHFESVVYSRSSDIEDSPVNDRYAEGMHVVPPPMTGIYIPSGPDVEIDESQFTYGPKQSKPSESDARNSDFNSCESISPLNFSHLIRDCDFHEKRMAKQSELNKRMCKGTGQTENRPVWNNVQRVNHQNQFVPTAVLTRTGRIPVNTARASSTNNVNTARHNFNSQAAPTNAARKVNTVKPIVNNDVPHKALENKGIVDSGCSRHMTGNKAYLAEYQDYNGGPVAFGGSKGYITGKGPKEANHSAGTQDNIDAENSKMEVESAQDYFVLPIWSSYTSTVKILEAKNEGEKPNKTTEKPVDQEDQAFLEELERLKSQENEAIDAAEALRKEFSKDTEDLLLQAGAARASSTNTVNTASTPVSIASPSGGLFYTDLTNSDQDDSQIPTLEDSYNNPNDGIFTNASYDDEDPKLAVQTRSKVNKSSGAHAFKLNPRRYMTPLEDDSWVDWLCIGQNYCNSRFRKFSNVLDSCRFALMGKKAIGTKAAVYKNKRMKDWDSYMSWLEIRQVLSDGIRKSAFLYDTIDKVVYVSQPLGFVDPKCPKKVYKVVKALYGLHQAPRAWYATFSTFLLKSGYRRGTIDMTLFIKKDKNDIMLVQVYVDDIIFGSTKRSWCDEFEALMKNGFQMSSIGELTFFLGLQVKQKEDGIFISQDKYVAEILKKFDFASVKTVSIPIETQKPLVKDEEATNVTPKTSHFNAVKRIFRYLKGKPKLGLWYPRVSSFNLEAYSDSDYAGANLDRKSTTGGCQFLGRRLISWQCKKQTIVATSTTEAEYVAAANCCEQVL
ncbi:putative ribonuclease H-like domain-containing protein [Tanacetum coccineum]